MKTEHFKQNYKALYTLIFSCILLLGCSNNDDGNATITFNYQAESFEVEFRTQGTIPAPTVDWPNEDGTFSLKNEVNGLEINTSTGAIDWSRSLNIGEHQIVVVAQDSKGSRETSFVLTNVLKNSFWSGGVNNDPDSQEFDFNRQLWLYEDGTLKINIPDSPDSDGVGVWSIEGNQIEFHSCTYCADLDPFSIPSYDEHLYFTGTLNNEDLKAYFSGSYSVIRFDPDSEMVRGNFYLEWD